MRRGFESVRRVLSGLVLLFSMLLAAAPAQAAWRRAESTHFTIYSEASAEDLRAVAEKLERFDGLLRRLTPVPPRWREFSDAELQQMLAAALPVNRPRGTSEERVNE